MKTRLTAVEEEKSRAWGNVAGGCGFTLTELLVVVGILALLASLLIPALNRAKTKSKSIQCLSNLHQLDLGLAQFVSDFHVYPLNLNPKFVEGGYNSLIRLTPEQAQRA